MNHQLPEAENVLLAVATGAPRELRESRCQVHVVDRGKELAQGAADSRVGDLGLQAGREEYVARVECLVGDRRRGGVKTLQT